MLLVLLLMLVVRCCDVLFATADPLLGPAPGAPPCIEGLRYEAATAPQVRARQQALRAVLPALPAPPLALAGALPLVICAFAERAIHSVLQFLVPLGWHAPPTASVCAGQA